MSNYWQERMAKSQNKISDKNIAQIEKQMKKYYKETMKTVIEEYEKTLLKIQVRQVLMRFISLQAGASRTTGR